MWICSGRRLLQSWPQHFILDRLLTEDLNRCRKCISMIPTPVNNKRTLQVSLVLLRMCQARMAMLERTRPDEQTQPRRIQTLVRHVGGVKKSRPKVVFVNCRETGFLLLHSRALRAFEQGVPRRIPRWPSFKGCVFSEVTLQARQTCTVSRIADTFDESSLPVQMMNSVVSSKRSESETAIPARVP